MHVQDRDSPEDLTRALKAQRDGRVRDRIRAVLLAKGGGTAKRIAGELLVSPRTVQDWVCWYNQGGLEALPDGPRSGHPRTCPKDKLPAAKERILKGPRPEDHVCTLRGRDVQRILKEEFGVVQKLSTTYALLHELGFSLLRPRPRHRKNDPEAMKAWEAAAPLLCRPSATPARARPSRSGSRMRPASVSRAR